MNLFPPNSRHPRRAFRGKRRYFRKVRSHAASFHFDPQESSFWNYWHYHADWPGWGNVAWSYRREHIKALCEVFLKIASAKDRFQPEFQSWIHLSAYDSGQDATFVHSPKADDDKTPFPHTPEDVTWDVPELLHFLEPQLPGLELRVGSRSGWDKWREPPGPLHNYIAYAVGVGIPLEPARR